MNLTVKIGNLTFKNPVVAASGTFGYGSRFPEVANGLGGVITKGITLRPRPGNPPPRIFETAGGMLNSIGLENIGVESFRRDTIPLLEPVDTAVIVNIAGFTVEEYGRLAEMLTGVEKIRAFELNISCPNVRRGGVEFGRDPKVAARVVRTVRRATKKLVIPKLTANFTDPVLVGRACEDEGADALSIPNTLHGLAVDGERRRAFLGGFSGGLSGPAIKPFALYCVHAVASTVGIPVIGGGGVMTGDDAVEFLIAGARLVSVGSATLVNPHAGLEIVEGLKSYCQRYNIDDIKQIMGVLRKKSG